MEDAFKFLKICLGWEEVQPLDLRGIRTLVTLGWVVAGFLFDLGVSFDWAEVQLLAKLGGWESLKDRTPGKITLHRGLVRLLEMLATQAILSRYATAHQGLPPTSPLCYTAGNLRGIYEWMSDGKPFSVLSVCSSPAPRQGMPVPGDFYIALKFGPYFSETICRAFDLIKAELCK